MHVLVLLTDGFGGFGGISKFNRDFLTALDASSLVDRVTVWPRVISEAIDDPLPTSVIYDRRFSRGKFAYLKYAISAILTGEPIDLVVCGHINLLPIAWLVAKTRSVRLALIIHGIDAWIPTKNAFTNFVAKRIDSLISVSMVSARRFCSWSKVPIERVFILPNSIDLERFRPGPKSEELLSRYNLRGKKILLTVGRLASEERYKGFDEVLEVLPELSAHFPDIRYVIGGSGPDASRLKAKAASLGIADQVIFAGRIPEVEKVDHFRMADIYVMPSSGEGFGIVLLEAAACGVPVIGSEIDGSSEALMHGELGLLIDPESRSELTAAIKKTFDQTAKRRRGNEIGFFSEANFRNRVVDWLRLVTQ